LTVLVDEAVWPWRGRRWAHLVSDESLAELHAFAAEIGIPRQVFQGDHYDVHAELREKALEHGATPVGARELARRLQASGLRLSTAQRRERKQRAETEPSWRWDPLRQAWTVVARERQDRPNLPAVGCPFCPGGLESPEPYDVRWFENRWPAMADQRCEVVLYTDQHDATFWSLGVEGARRVVDLWADRTTALGSREDVAYVLVFENRGPEVGATIAHPHGQVYAYPDVPPVPRTELEADECTFCDEGWTLPESLLVSERGDGPARWQAACPPASSWPHELLLAPDAHVPDLPSLDPDGRDAMAGLLVDVLQRLDRLFDAPMPYMLWIHQRPTDGREWSEAHLHVHVAPVLRKPGTLRFVAAAEQGAGVFFNPVAPEDAAAALRAVGADGGGSTT
jgi:UDPglucose--hexose-1-phosphate uridylyltransferase